MEKAQEIKTYALKSSDPKSDMNQTLNGQVSMSTLPLTINLRWSRACQFIKTGLISPTPCEVFQEDLVYSFYGIPAFKPDEPDNNTKTAQFRPICFLIDTSKFVPTIAFPFDSGAYARGYFQEGYLPPEYDLFEYSIIPQLEMIKGYIHLVYGTNENYLRQEPQTRPDHRKYADVVNALLSLINTSGTNSFDNRCSVVEFISRVPVNILDAVTAIICPRAFRDVKDIKDKMAQLEQGGVKFQYYYPFGGGPTQYIGSITERSYEFYEDQEIVHNLMG